VELCDESPGFEPLGLVEIWKGWKGNHHGDQVSIKVIRTRRTDWTKEIKRVRGSFFNQSQTQRVSRQIYCHEAEEYKYLSHPNILPIIEISETLFPLCIMSPWMPDGNIVQYTQKNQNADRLMLARIHCD